MPRNKTSKKLEKEKKLSKKIAPIKLPKKKILQFAIALVLVPSFYTLIRHSHYFDLVDIRIVDKQGVSEVKRDHLLKLYKQQNIFDIDIDSLADRIVSDYPVIKDAVVRRVLPNRLEVEVIPRVPVAMIRSYEYFPIDREGMVLPPSAKSEDLPIITGLSIWLSPRVGERLKNKQLESAFSLLDALNESHLARDYNVTTINVANYRNLSFYLENGIEIKIGSTNFSDRLRMLSSTLAKPDLDKSNIKYIDLRFRDVVIGPK